MNQQTSFLNFTITFTNGTTAGTYYPIDIKNGGSTVRTGSVTTVEENSKVMAHFVAAMPAGTKMSGATVQWSQYSANSFGGTTTLIANKIYNINKTVTSYIRVDLGLSVDWANKNVGAAAETDYGKYYAWGATTDNFGQNEKYEWKNTPYYTGNGTDHGWSKYNTTPSTLERADDAAHASMGLSWRMPTEAEFQELLSNTTKTEYSGENKYNGVNGILLTIKNSGYTDKSIFLPAAGERQEWSLDYDGLEGYYWSSTHRDKVYIDGSKHLLFSSGCIEMDDFNRFYGFTIRAVWKD